MTLTPDDERFLRLAIELSSFAKTRGEAPFGSLLVAADGALLAQAHNSVLGDRDITAHPELKLARWAARELGPKLATTVTMYTSCEPCAMCAGAIDRSGIRRVVYALSSGQLAGFKRPAGSPAVIAEGPALLEEARAPVEEYYRTAHEHA
ncbi:MAG TPA: nucleoside deaminase [Steroidobacteraceae bacterium]|jgi:tRNA(Arg) A34 adenosine deaminase TadA|nr:nucleoside deaminase [Steroidobacteraceae bacterium]